MSQYSRWPFVDQSMGTVTSVGLAVPAWLTVSGSPVTSAGTLTIGVASQAANLVLASPDGAPGVLSPRALVAADIPALPYLSSTLTSAHLFIGNGSNVATDTALSGDATISNTGVLTISNNAVSNAKLAQMPTLTIKGNNTGGTANALDLTVSQVNTMLGDVTTVGSLDGQSASANGLVISGNSIFAQSASASFPGLVNTTTQSLAGNKTFTGSISASNLSGTNTGDQTITLTGDVTGSGTSSFAATIAVGAVTDTKASLATKPAVAVVATSNITLSGLQTIDGISVAANTLVLLSAQSTGAENGPWQAQVGAWTRPTWYPSGGTTQAFQFITSFVRLGTTYQGTVWRQTAAAPITIDTTATTWVVTPLNLNTSTVNGSVSFPSSITFAGGLYGTSGNIVSVSSNHTVQPTEFILLLDSSGGAFNLTLPAPSLRQSFWIKCATGSCQTNNVTIVRNGSEQIDGTAASKVFGTNWGSWLIVSDGTNWFILG